MQHPQKTRLDFARIQISGHHIHHHLHHRQPGHPQARERLLALRRRLRFHPPRVIRRSLVAAPAHPQQNVRQRHLRAVPRHPRPQRAVVDFRTQHACKPQKLLLNQPHAGRTGYPAQHQHRLALVFRLHFHKFRLHVRQVVQLQLFQHLRRRQHRLLRLLRAAVVVAAQPGSNNALRHRLAARATGRMARAFKFNRQIQAARHGQAAVETGFGLGLGFGWGFGVTHDGCV